MGQGTDSCGGYDVDYDPYEEGMASGEWTQRNGVSISITAMTLSHLHGARRVAQGAAQRATFSSDREQWEEWVEMFDREIASRPAPIPKAVTAPKAPPRGKMTVMICHCKQEYKAREADLKRGNGYSCSKRCAAIRREFGRPPAKRMVP